MEGKAPCNTAVFTVTLLPIRVAIICFFLIIGWMFASIGLWGITEMELREKPLHGWRKSNIHVINGCFCMKHVAQQNPESKEHLKSCSASTMCPTNTLYFHCWRISPKSSWSTIDKSLSPCSCFSAAFFIY
ncbi:hypothetical protein NQ315_005908 [Exocentrus adspersus]|uniref:Uncharacterized protein n=1 Tax=Exocentrus adspersus TaxID=1586481 RepID=A0AAV8V601_9CUCU|nr:hypothetical protein NQ315_005908 [Exocentrus adspersus]